MLELWTVLIPILLADIVNPVLFAFMVYAAGTDRPLTNSVAALLGHTAAYFFFGIIIALAFNAITARLANPESMDYWISLVIGILLLWVAWGSHSSKTKDKTEPESKQLTPVKAFGIGAVINIIGIPFALPYFAALDQILMADLNTTRSVIVICIYNLGYALPFLVVPALALMMGDASRPVLASINKKVDAVSAFLMPLTLVLVGLFLVVDALRYFATGKGLI